MLHLNISNSVLAIADFHRYQGHLGNVWAGSSAFLVIISPLPRRPWQRWV